MSNIKVTKSNFKYVMTNIIIQFENSDNDTKEMWCEDLNNMLDMQRDEDFFGTEGQLDPRGDNRNN